MKEWSTGQGRVQSAYTVTETATRRPEDSHWHHRPTCALEIASLISLALSQPILSQVPFHVLCWLGTFCLFGVTGQCLYLFFIAVTAYLGYRREGEREKKKGQGPTITNSFQTDKHCFIQKTSAQDTAPGWHPPTYTGRPTFPPYPFNPTFNHHGGQTIAPCHRLETKARSISQSEAVFGREGPEPQLSDLSA